MDRRLIVSYPYPSGIEYSQPYKNNFKSLFNHSLTDMWSITCWIPTIRVRNSLEIYILIRKNSHLILMFIAVIAEAFSQQLYTSWNYTRYISYLLSLVLISWQDNYVLNDPVTTYNNWDSRILAQLIQNTFCCIEAQQNCHGNVMALKSPGVSSLVDRHG